MIAGSFFLTSLTESLSSPNSARASATPFCRSAFFCSSVLSSGLSFFENSRANSCFAFPTIQAIAALAHLAAEGRTHFLVVCPASVLVNWTREIAARSALRPVPLHGPERRDAFAEWREAGGVGVTTCDALRGFDVPSQNVLYADVEGNIGYQAPGRIPIRRGGDGRWPAYGWDTDYEWDNMIPFDSLPFRYNPPEGYIVSFKVGCSPLAHAQPSSKRKNPCSSPNLALLFHATVTNLSSATTCTSANTK